MEARHQSLMRQNFPKAAFSSPLDVGTVLAAGSSGTSGKGARGAAQATGRTPGKPDKTGNTPTHIAFAQPSPSAGSGNFGLGGGYAGFGSAPGGFGRQTQGDGSKGEPQRAPTRQGALYGALEALQAATKTLNQPDDISPGRPAPEAGGAYKGAKAGLSPEEVWQSIPSGGEAAWRSSNSQRPARLRVARLQEALSEAAAGLQKANEACRGGGEDDPASAKLGAASLGPPGPTAALRNECAVLEAESKELDEEKAFLDARMVEVKQELARVKESFQASPSRRAMIPEDEASTKRESPGLEATSDVAKGSSADDVSELAVVLRLLACLKDLAVSNRSIILPADPSKWTREQQVVAYFLDEVEACSSNMEGAY